MIKFFRRIRQKLIAENRFTKYLLYALGEIILVVIGILIALQINNWNEFKKERKQERKVLTELLSSLESNHSRMLADSILRNKWNKSSKIIINHFENKNEYSDTLNKHFQDARKPGTNLALSYAGYESLKNVGYNIISSDTLRKSIIELFELTHKSMLEEMEYFESFQPERQAQLDRLFSYETAQFNPNDPFNVPISPNNYEKLEEDEIYLPIIKSVTIQRNMISILLYNNINETEKVIKMIKNELSITDD